MDQELYHEWLLRKLREERNNNVQSLQEEEE